MSRLIVKNIPVYITPHQLKEHFSQKGGPGGTITDVKVSFKQDGTSRRFGFIGYKNEEEAGKSRKWFDGTFIGSTRVSVGVVEGAKDAPAPRPNKRRKVDIPTAGTSQVVGSRPSEVDASKDTSKKKQLNQFMEVMQPKKGPSWANDVPTPLPIASSSKSQSKNPDLAPNEDDGPQNQGELDDLEWMKRHMSRNVDVDIVGEKVFEQSDDEDENENKTEAVDAQLEPQPHHEDPTKETILQTCRLFLRNLAYSCTDEELCDLFTPFGEIVQVHTPRDSQTQQHKGVAYITFKQGQDALSAYESLDKTSFQGRLLHILPAVDRRAKESYTVEDGEGKKKTVKDERKDKKKAVAGRDFNWGVLYMNSDAVASSIADRMGIPKADILNPDSSLGEGSGPSTNPAVKLALAETHIIHETKTYLESQGIDLTSFSSLPSTSSTTTSTRPQPPPTIPRSKTTILVKNIPYGTTPNSIEELFSPYGTLSRVIVPPSGTIAVVEYDNPQDAQKGFRGVVYKRIGSGVVYLEWAPGGVWKEGGAIQPLPHQQRPADKTKVGGEDEVEVEEGEGQGNAGDGPLPSIHSNPTLYIKNLSFATTLPRLLGVVSNLPSFMHARIQTKTDGETGKKLSMGYAFVGFKDLEGAKKALSSLKGFVLDGRVLNVDWAGRGREESDAADSKSTSTSLKKTSTKLIIKNVPFEASRKDLRDLFSVHAPVKSVRLPRKLPTSAAGLASSGTRTRGFAFLEFHSRRDAEVTFEALRYTHLLGRHLVLEWAADDDEEDGDEGGDKLERLRKKVKAGFGDGKASSREMMGRKRKLDLGKGNEDVEDYEG